MVWTPVLVLPGCSPWLWYLWVRLSLPLGVVGGVVALVVAVVGIATGDRGAVRLSVLTLMLVLTGVIGLPFGIWFAVAAVWLVVGPFLVSLLPKGGSPQEDPHPQCGG